MCCFVVMVVVVVTFLLYAIYQPVKCIYKIVNKNRHAIRLFIAAVIRFNQTLFFIKTIVFNYSTFHNRDILSLLIRTTATGSIGIIMLLPLLTAATYFEKCFTFRLFCACRAFPTSKTKLRRRGCMQSWMEYTE